MQTRMMSWTIAAVLAGCGSSSPAPSNPPPPSGDPAPPPMAERKAITQDQCAAEGGSVVGDIGDGATQRPGYVCPSGKPPLGSIAQPAGGPMAIEGGVCCPA